MFRKEKLHFPKGFLWGTATSAHQVEGNNKYNDWWQWEKGNRDIENSGKTTDQYHRYKADFKLAKNVLHNNAHRLGIEWARIEPEEGKIDEKEIQHYKNVFEELKSLDMKIMLTLHHFTSPAWFSEKGGFSKRENNDHFIRFVELCALHFGKYVDFWVTFNEPNIYVMHSYILGSWPPQKRSPLRARKVMKHMAHAHTAAYTVLHRVLDNPSVGPVINMTSLESGSVLMKPVTKVARRIINNMFLYMTNRTYDFIGINYYAHHRNTFGDVFLPFKRLEQINIQKLVKGDVTDLGWPIYPRGIYRVVMETWKRFKAPIYITENGLADKKDLKRERFIRDHLAWLHQSIKDRADVRGYFHWSLIDNFEWHEGRDPKFGLFEIDYKTLKRTSRPSAQVYGTICRENAV